MTKARLLSALRCELLNRYAWAANSAELDRFMLSVKDTLNGKKCWNKDGEAFKAAWRSIGGKGNPTYKQLQAMPD